MDEKPSWSTNEKGQSFASTQYNEAPPSYPPPPYPPHSQPPPGNTAAPPMTHLQNSGTNSQWQYQWQGPSTSSTAQHPAPGVSREPLPPTPSSSVTVVRSPSPSSGFNKKRDPLNPPPPSFSRPAPPRTPLPPFPPLTLNSKEAALDKGFPFLLPTPSHPPSDPYLQQPNFIHPFFQRDVMEADWTRLLEDIYILAQLSTGEKIAANVIPFAAGVGFIGGIFLTRAIEKRIKKKKNNPVADLVDTWNQYFFHMRGLHVILARGPENLSGELDGPAPDWIQHGSTHDRQDSSSSDSSSEDCSSSDSSSEDESRHESGFGSRHERRQARRAARRERREARRAARRERRQDKRERREERREERRARRARRKAAKYERYRLVVVPI